MPFMAARAANPVLLFLAVWTAMALPMTGQRRAMVCRLDMLPPPGEEWKERVGPLVADSALRVAGEVFFKKGHIALDWRSTVSMFRILIVVASLSIWREYCKIRSSTRKMYI
jgi:hypothetical protein